jgi:hypothetical protein
MVSVVNNALELGAIYLIDTDDRPLRIIGLDEAEVFYDCLWGDMGWSFASNFRRKVYFYRMSAKIFAKRTKKIDFKQLTNEELNAFRPDLPLTFIQTKKLSWNDFKIQNYVEFINWMKHEFNEDLNQIILKTNKITLIPRGNKGGLKKGIIITADNADHFTTSELIWKAKEIQESVNTEISNGIRIYRAGFEKGIPSYFIGTYDKV